MFPRHLEKKLKIALEHFPVTLIQGARQVGKSTLLFRLLNTGALAHIVTLDDISILSQAKSDPHGFIENLPKPVGIDEIQRAPELMLAIKKYVDSNKRAGDFVLTGSANIFSYPETQDGLTGRMAVLSLYGLALSETMGQEGECNLLEYLHHNKGKSIFELQRRIDGLQWDEQGVWERVFSGGYPDLVLSTSAAHRLLWLQSFISIYIERDLRDLAKDMTGYYKFFQYMGLTTGQQLVMSNASIDLKSDQRTLLRYLELLEMTFQVQRLEPFFTNKIKKIVKNPKLYLQDSALACHFFELSDVKALKGSPHKGAILETFVENQLQILTNEADYMKLEYLRTSDGQEIDFISHLKGSHLLIECKSQRPSPQESFKSLANFQSGEPGSLGLILYPGKEILMIGKDLYALPIAALALRFPCEPC